jgi:Fe-S cluster assembly ATP-binding protein
MKVETRGGTMIEIRNLTVSVQNRKILHDVELHVSQGETVALFGPNGSGKTSLLHTIIGIPKYTVESGTILFKGRDITKLSIDERARLGIGMAFQRPPAVRGVKLNHILDMCMAKRGVSDYAQVNDCIHTLHLSDLRDRDVNLGFSGGEVKRSELIQLLAQNPDFILFDEPDSGVDLVSIQAVGRVINVLLEKEMMTSRRTKAAMIISHTGHILDYVNADRAYVMLHGTMYCAGNPRDLLDDIREKGYEGCIACKR